MNSETAHKADIFFSDRACSWRSSRRTRWFINRSWYTCRFWNGSNRSSGTDRSSYWRAGIGGGGSLIGAFIGLGIPEEHAKKYEEYIYDGNILILVDAKLDNKLEIYKIFDKHHAYNSDFFK